MRVFVTGGLGFIGSHTTLCLLEAGHEVTVLDNLSNGHREHLPDGVSFIEGDLADARLSEWLAGQDIVIHLAAFVPVPESVKRPVEFVENNVVNTVRLLEAMRAAAVHRIVFSSSATVYGEPERLPVQEDDRIALQSNPYGASKVAAEGFLAVYHRLYGLDVTVLRYFNPYGPNELCDPETHLVPNVVRAGLEKRAIPLFWRGDQVRDFIYVGDLARAHVAVLGMSGLNYFNVGSETGIKVLEVVEAVGRALGYELDIEDLGERPGDVPANYATSARLRGATSWRPEVDLQEGLSRTVEFYRTRAGR